MRREKMEVAIAIAAPNRTHHGHHLDHHQQHRSQKLKHTEHMNFRSKKRKSLSLENYLAFLRSRDHRDLTVDHLREIMSIHGFRKLKQQRKDVEEAVEAIELKDPTRSTLNDKISPEAFIKLEESIKDLGTLNWLECSVTGIRSINALNHAPVPLETATELITSKAKKRSASTPPATSLSSGNVGSGPNESASVCGSSSLSQKANNRPRLTMSATSSSWGDNGCCQSKTGSGGGSISLGVADGKDGAVKKWKSRKRRSIKRVLLSATVPATDTVNSI